MKTAMFDFDLSQDIECYLLTQPSCREYDIIRHLQEIQRMPKTALANSLSMFRCHFLVFNALHRIKAKWQNNPDSNIALEISSLRISTKKHVENQNTHTKTQQQAEPFDPLSLFYLDLTQLNQTTETDINKLLDQFWLRFTNGPLDTVEKEQALETLELKGDVDFSLIKKQYRRLAMRHHPDRGGDKNKLIAIHQAMECLENYY